MTEVKESHALVEDLCNRTDMTHLFCDCNEDVSFCGLDISALPCDEDINEYCIVCAEMSEKPCERCGAIM